MAMLHWLRQHPFPGLVDIAAAYNSITIAYDLYLLPTKDGSSNSSHYVRDLLLEAYRQSGPRDELVGTLKRIPVCYESPFAADMEYIMAAKELTREQIISLHEGRTYQVYMIGFLPGFPYLGELDSRLFVPRKTTPRSRVEAGSVGIAGGQTGIYPVVSPGGWQIIGRTPMLLFDRASDPPVALEAGDEVQFYRISSDEFRSMEQHNA